MSTSTSSSSSSSSSSSTSGLVIGDPTQPYCPPTPASVAAPALFSLRGKHALLTGGTRGIGQACAVALAQAGARVCLVVRPGADRAAALGALPAASPLSSEESAGEKEEHGHGHETVEADLADMQSVKQVVPRALEVMGAKIDILVNCAGIQRRHKSEEFPESDWDEVIDVNLKSVWLLSQAVGAHLLARRAPGGKIINFGSLLTFQGGLTVPAYAAAKGAVGQFTKTLSNEWSKHGIQVNGIAPGYIATDMNEKLLADATRLRQISERIPANRWGAPWDFAGPVLFLASDASRYVSGEMLVVDGGWMGR